MLKIFFQGFRPIAFSTFILLFVTVSCVKENFDFDRLSDQISYRPSFIIPLAHGSLTLGNILEPDDSLVFFDPDNAVRIMIRDDSVTSIFLNDIIDLSQVQQVSRQFTINPVSLDGFNSAAIISLGDLTGPGHIGEPESSAISGASGSNSIFPGVPLQNAGVFPADNLPDIDYVRLTEGMIELMVTNGLPVGITLEILMKNEYDGSHIGFFSFNNLEPGQSLVSSGSLEGRVVRNQVSLELISFTSPGSGDDLVFIDLNDAIDITISSSGLKAEKGRARVPVTLLDSASDIVDLSFKDDQLIESFNLESANLEYEIPNNSCGLTLDIDFLNTEKDGSPYGFDLVTDGYGGLIKLTSAISDVDVDFDGYGHNLHIEYTLSVGSDAGFTEFDLTTGNIDFSLMLRDLVPGHVTGYFGKDQFTLDEEEYELGFDLFRKITGDFRITNPSMRIFYSNSIGVPMNLSFNIRGESADGNKEADLLGIAHEGFTLSVPGQPGEMAEGEILLDRETSGIVDFISLPPSAITIAATTFVNPEGKTSVPNFISSESSFQMGMEIELPLEMQLANLGLTDTIPIDINPGDLDIIENLILSLDVYNNFPLGAGIDVILYDSVAGAVLHTFENILLAGAAGVDADGIASPGNGTVTHASAEVTGVVVDHLKQATHIIVSALMNTGMHNGQQIPVKFRTTDNLDFTIRLKAGLSL
ncbi:MAG: hypothetical protein ACFCUM_06260 [Bacteroidales bacterium]